MAEFFPSRCFFEQRLRGIREHRAGHERGMRQVATCPDGRPTMRFGLVASDAIAAALPIPAMNCRRFCMSGKEHDED